MRIWVCFAAVCLVCIVNLYLLRTDHDCHHHLPPKIENQTVLEQTRIVAVEPTTFVSVALVGRLGNQLFVAASSYGIAQSRGSRWCIHGLENSLLRSAVVFSVEPEQCPPDVRFEVMREEGDRVHHFNAQFNIDRLGENVQVGDYLQSYKYFSNVSLPFRLKDGEWGSAWVSQKGVKVGVHVRRGDYIENANGAVPPPSFYEKVLGLIPSLQPGEVVICSDDPAWVRSQPVFGGMLISEGHSPAQDLAILAACRYVVVSIGTFGWWGGFLAHRDQQSTVIYDSEPYNAVRVNVDDVKHDFFPPEWVGVSP